MSIGPMGMVGSVAGTPLSQSKGGEAEKTQQDAANQSRQVHSEQKAEQASGVGQTEQDEQASDRDADGRRLWEGPPEGEQDNATAGELPATSPPISRDPTGQRGGNLDMSG